MAIEVPHNEEIFGGGKNKGRKGDGSAIRWRRASGGSINIKKRERRSCLQRDVDLYIIRVGAKRRKRVGGKFRER